MIRNLHNHLGIPAEILLREAQVVHQVNRREVVSSEAHKSPQRI